MQRRIEATSLFILLGVTILRPLVSESYSSAESAITAALVGVSDAAPVRTLVFDLLIVLGACGWLLSRALGPAYRYRWTGLEWGGAVVAVAVVVSCVAAGNKRLAINGSVDWICYPLLSIALVQLAWRPSRRRILLAAVLASACVQAFHCFDQYFFSFENTWEHYQGIKADMWAQQGVELESAKVEMFEKRMLAREAYGFMPHSNLAGSYLVLCGFAAVGVVLSGWRLARSGVDRLAAVACAVCAGGLFAASVLTKSLGATASAAAGLVVWATSKMFSGWIGAHRAKAVAIGSVLGAIGLLALAGHGYYNRAFPNKPLAFDWQYSLMFRWQYWTASWEMIKDHALTGIGRENFGRHYLQYKAIDSPEEIANPHNLFVQAAADWGLVGLVGIGVMIVGTSLVVTRARAARDTGLETSGDSSSGGLTVAWALALGLVVTLGRLPLLGNSDPSFLYYTTVVTGMVWLAGFFCFSGGVASASGRDGALGNAAAVGLFTFLLHDMINFATFTPATATTAFALLAFCIAERSPSMPVRGTTSSGRRWFAFVAMVGVALLLTILAVRPVARAGQHLAAARRGDPYVESLPPPAKPVYYRFQQAARRDRLDPTPLADCAKWLLTTPRLPQQRSEALRLAADSLERAVARDPFDVSHRRMQMQLYRFWAVESGDSVHYGSAVDAAKAALGLYPLDPTGIVALADCQALAGEATGSSDLLRDAISNYERALTLDNSRAPWEKIRRFRDGQVETVRAKITKARSVLAGLP